MEKLELTGYMVAQIKKMLKDSVSTTRTEAIIDVMRVLRLDPFEEKRKQETT